MASNEENERNKSHIDSKVLTKQEKDRDKQLRSNTKAVVCFDLQNFIATSQCQQFLLQAKAQHLQSNCSL